MSFQPAPKWSVAEFEEARLAAIERFRLERMEEPLEQYLLAFDECRDAYENLMRMTEDLRVLGSRAVDVLVSPPLREAVRYLAGPPISEDDLGILAQARLSPGALISDPMMGMRAIDTVLLALDRNRFPWMAEGRKPTDDERTTAIVASAALMAARRVMTGRANESKKAQEDAVAACLAQHEFTEVPTRRIRTLDDAPRPGEFCRECAFGSRKADIVIRLRDGRVMPTECKVSNSSTNSIKRLNNDAAVKAAAWIHEFGTISTVPTAVLAGVFKCGNLTQAQESGLTIFWAHALQPLVDFLASATSD